MAFEVAAKLQDREQDDLDGGIHDAIRGRGPVPENVGHSMRRHDHGSIEMFESVSQPFGRPNPAKANDSARRLFRESNGRFPVG